MADGNGIGTGGGRDTGGGGGTRGSSRGTGRLFWGLIFLVVGVLLLLGNLGVVGWQMLWGILQLWPLLLVLAGLLVLLRGGPILYTWLAILVVFLMGALLLVFAGPRWGGWQWGSPDYRWDFNYNNGRNYNYGPSRGQNHVEVPPDGGLPATARLKLEFGSERLELAGDSALQQALVGDLGYWRTPPDFRYSRSNGSLDVTIRQGRGDWPAWLGPGQGEGDFSWGLRLSDKVAWNLELDTGASDSMLDLSLLRVSSLKVNNGASRLVVRFGDTGVTTTGKINSGVSDLRLEVPPSVGVRLRVDGALANTNIGGMGFILDNKTYTSPNFSSARSKVDLELDIGVSNLTLSQGGGSV